MPSLPHLIQLAKSQISPPKKAYVRPERTTESKPLERKRPRYREPQGLPVNYPLFPTEEPDWIKEPQPLVNPFHLEPNESGIHKFYRRHSLIFHIPLAIIVWHVVFILPALVAVTLDPAGIQVDSQDFRIIYASLIGGLVLDVPFLIPFLYRRASLLREKIGITNSAVLPTHQLAIPYMFFSFPIGVSILERTTKKAIMSAGVMFLSSFLAALFIAIVLYVFIIERHFTASEEAHNTKRKVKGLVDFVTFGPLGRLGKADHEDPPWIIDMP